MSKTEQNTLLPSVENEKAEKRRPGRPRKANANNEANEKNENAIIESVKSEISAKNQKKTVEIEASAEPKKRGRKPKAKQEEQLLLVQEEVKEKKSVAPEQSESKSNKVRRGRPAKAKDLSENIDAVEANNHGEARKQDKAKENVEAQAQANSTHASITTEEKHENARRRAPKAPKFVEDNISMVIDSHSAPINAQTENISHVNTPTYQDDFYNNQPRGHAQNQDNDSNKRRLRKPRNDNRNNRPKFNQPQFQQEQGNFYNGQSEYSQNNFDYSYNSNNNQKSRNQKNFTQKQRNNKQTNPSYNEVGFDNSSIIAAISGKTIQQNFEFIDNNESQNFDQFQGQNRNKGRNLHTKNRLHNKRSKNQQNMQHSAMPEFASDDSLISQFKSYGSKPSQSFENISEQFIEDNFSQAQIQEAENKNKNIAPLAVVEENDLENKQQNTQARNQRNTHFAAEELHGQPNQLNYGQNLKMYIGVQPDEQIEIALTDNKVVVEYFVEMSHQAKIRGNIYKGVIHNVDPNLQAVFVNFGAERNGFLQIDEVHPDYYLSPHTPNKNHKFPLISKVLRPGQEILVQIVKEPTGTKGAFLTTWISLAGRYLVLTPGQEQIGVSRKVSDQEERGRLRELLEGIDPGEDMGIIIRTAAANASREEIEADLEYLQDLWVDIVERANSSAPQSLIHQEVDLAERVMRDYLTENIKEIWTDDSDMAERMGKITKDIYPSKRKMVKLHSDPRQSLWDRFNLQTQIYEITSREISLPSGGRVAFDQTEALMAIDINSGKTQNKASFHSMVLQTNIEAARAIARHLRLRDIGGQIVIDFIELRDKSSVREVEKAFQEAMRPDRARYEIGSISPFGLLEIVRQRIGSSAISISSEPCPHCKGTGIRRNMEWQAQDALKEIARKARAEKTIKYTHTCEKELALYLLNTKRDRIQEIEEQLMKRIEIII